jgi:hypothetical protein
LLLLGPTSETGIQSYDRELLRQKCTKTKRGYFAALLIFTAPALSLTIVGLAPGLKCNFFSTQKIDFSMQEVVSGNNPTNANFFFVPLVLTESP